MPASPLSPSKIGSRNWLFGTNFEDAITALAGGGQTGAYAITAQMSRLTTVATAADSVALPKVGVQQNAPGALGFLCFIDNDGANAAQVFASSPDVINGIATGTGVVLPAGSMMIAWPITYVQSTNVGFWSAVIVPDAAGASAVGSFVTATVATPGAGASTNTPANVTSISLTAGDWDVSGTVDWLPAANTSITQINAGISLTTGTLPGQAGGAGLGTDGLATWSQPAEVPTALVITQPVGPVRVNIAATTTVYLVQQATFTVNTLNAYGTIRARRAA